MTGEDGHILLLDQDADTGRSWSLPGGKAEEGEALGDALVREMREEAGLEVQVGRSARAGFPGSYMGGKAAIGL